MIVQRRGLIVTAALSGGFLLVLTGLADARTALVRSGLFDDFGVFTRPVEDGLREQGYKVTRKPWWAYDDGQYDLEVGHSRGADAVLSSAKKKKKPKKIIAIDPTFLNPGCEGHRDCSAYVGSINKFLFLVCCGGYRAAGAKNVEIGGTLSFFIIAPGHASAPARALPQILKQTR